MALVRKSLRYHWVRLRNLSTASLPEIPPCNHEPSAYDGADYDLVRKSHATNVSPGQVPFYKNPLLIHEGRGQWLWDHKGRRFLDMFGGIVTVSIGHCHPRVLAAINEQSSRLGHTTSIYMHPRLHSYVEKLTAKMPGDLKTVYLVNSGSEATELAFLMARVYTGFQEVISLQNGYHGGTQSATAATAMSTWRYSAAHPPGHLHAVNPDVYRGPWGGSGCRDSPVQPGNRKCQCTGEECCASQNYFAQLEDVFQFSLPNGGRLAAFIAESIQGIGGAVQYPKSYLKKAYDLVHQNGGLCIADEVQTGFGRTGEHFWGFQGHGVQPDIVTLAKGIGNGYPLGAVVTTQPIAEALKKALRFNTFGGSPVACAVGSAVLDVIEEEKLQENALVVGTHLLHRLRTVQLDYPTVIGDVRGKGLMIGVELVSDPRTKQPLPPVQMLEIFEDIKDMGVLVGKGGLYANVLRIKPPMCVTKADADFTVEVIKRAIENHRDRHLRDKESVFCGVV